MSQKRVSFETSNWLGLNQVGAAPRRGFQLARTQLNCWRGHRSNRTFNPLNSIFGIISPNPLSGSRKYGGRIEHKRCLSPASDSKFRWRHLLHWKACCSCIDYRCLLVFPWNHQWAESKDMPWPYWPRTSPLERSTAPCDGDTSCRRLQPNIHADRFRHLNSDWHLREGIHFHWAAHHPNTSLNTLPLWIRNCLVSNGTVCCPKAYGWSILCGNLVQRDPRQSLDRLFEFHIYLLPIRLFGLLNCGRSSEMMMGWKSSLQEARSGDLPIYRSTGIHPIARPPRSC